VRRIRSNEAGLTSLALHGLERLNEVQFRLVLEAIGQNTTLEDLGGLSRHLPVQLKAVDCDLLAKTIQGHPTLTNVDLSEVVASAFRRTTILSLLLDDSKCGLLQLTFGTENCSRTPIGNNGVEEVVAPLLRGNCKLHTLNLQWEGITTEGAEILGENLRSNTTLTGLSLANNAIWDQGLIGLLGHAESPLRRLSLDYSGIKLGGDEEETRRMLPMLSRLQALDLTGNKLRREVIRDLLTLASLSHLSDLSLNAVGLTPDLMDVLADYVVHNTSLRNLDVGCNYLQQVGAEYLTAVLGTNSSLTTLSVGNIHMGTGGLIAFAQAACENKTLTSLILYRSTVDKKGDAIKSLACFLRGNYRLKCLDISGCKLGEKDMFIIGKAMMQTPRLNPVRLITRGHSRALENQSSLRDTVVQKELGITVAFSEPGSMCEQEYITEAMVARFRECLLGFVMACHLRLGNSTNCRVQTLDENMVRMIGGFYFGEVW
jgi:hypothetical protein